MRVRAPAEKNFRRARARPARRRTLRALVSWRAARAILIVALVAVAGYRMARLAYDSSLFRVRHVRVHGNVRISPGEVQAIVGELKGAHILTANLARSRAALLESPWLAEAALRRVLPSTIDVYVSERRPFGLCRQANLLYLVAADGTLIDEFGPKYAAFDLPIIDGLFPRAASRVSPRSASSRVSRTSRAAQPAGPKADPARAALAARLVDAIEGTEELARRVSQIDVSNAHDAVVILDKDPALLHLGEERFRERLLSYLEIAEALRDRIPDIDYVDLRFERRVYVKPRGRAEGTAMQLPAAGRTF
jgi:cell division septal protein FtsQ